MAETTEIAYARKYRPKVISEYIGEDVKKKIFSRFGAGMTPPQVLLFYGLSGGGKTSAARLLTKEYLCTNKVDGRACGKCEMCMTIEESYIEKGEALEFIQELDIASDSGKANIDVYLNDAMAAPLYSEYKILILDEVHMATSQAQNRLLKITEEPPKHLIFILCTTNPEKLLPTLKGRCQLKVEVQRPKMDEMVDRLIYICQKEGIETSPEALKMICKKTNRAPRDTINLLEEVAKSNGNKVLLDTVAKHLGSVDNDIYLEYMKCANKGLDDISLFSVKLKEKNIEARDFLRGLTRFVLDCVTIRAGLNLEEYPAEYLKKVVEFFKVYTPDQIDSLLSIIEHALQLSADDVMAELSILTTAARISKIRILTQTLAMEREQSEVENKKAVKVYSENQEENRKETQNVKKLAANEKLMAGIFGRGVTSIVDTGALNDKKTPSLDDDTQDLDNLVEDKVMSAEDLAKKIMGEI